MKKEIWLIPAVVLGTVLLASGIYYYIFFVAKVKNTEVIFNFVPNVNVVPIPEEQVPDFEMEQNSSSLITEEEWNEFFDEFLYG